MCEDVGAPTLEDDLWFTSHMDDPIKRDPKPMEGQEMLPWFERRFMDERLDADEQRAREDERDQFNIHRPE